MQKKPEQKDNNPKKSEVALTEERVLANWLEKKIFEKTLDKTKDGKPFVFYDGPPFATGEPHYGHILAGTIKDAIPRYQTMNGRYVRRQWGWDCHGLPIENIIEQELNLGHKKEIEAYGVENFNEAARRAVLRFDKNWKETVPRLGRFVDMGKSYKTMDANYTESIWWAFKTLHDKGLIYEGHKIMYVCPRCETPLAQMEVAQGYKDITDISVTAKFELIDDPGTYMLAWTTTPWTLPGNAALAVNPDIEYLKVSVSGEKYILAKERLSVITGEHEILGTIRGSELVGRSYKPLFDYYVNDSPTKISEGNLGRQDIDNIENGWKIYGADFVTTETGTGIVHIAPAFGEDDMRLSRENKIPVIIHVATDGKFKQEVKDFAGVYVKQKDDNQSADILVIKYLAGKNSLFSKEKIVHSYPLCWRCDTPLLNYAVSSWFVLVTKIRDQIVAENNKVHWVPEHVGEGRFGKWLEGARDWAISRSRFWGAPLPVWKCAECDHTQVFGGVSELTERLPVSGNKYFVVRHGQSESNGSGIVNSDPLKEDHLTDNGKEQVIESARKIKESGVKIGRIISSDFMRTKETAEILAKELGVPVEHVIFDERIREINTGIFQGKTNEEYHEYFHNSFYEKFAKSAPEGESLLDVKKRALKAILDLEKTYHGENIIIVSHEYTSWMMFTAAKGADIDESIRMKEERGDDFLKNAECEELNWKLIPRNREGELDFHRPYIDEVIYDCSCGGMMKRIPEVFDCWFESGSMPYAQFHYPFENKDEFEKNFPADFIAEGLDQTRGWFYSLLILSVGLFGETPYKNVIVNGTILAEDGQKMSKRLKNYPEVMEVVNRYGADALRYYLLSSPVMHSEDLSLSEKGIDEAYKKNIARLNNVYAFYELYRLPAQAGGDEEGRDDSGNVLDRWIISRLNEIKNVMTEGMEKYEIDKAAKPIADFIDDLSTWYIRRSRERFKLENEDDKKLALSTTHFVLEEFSKLIAPFMPFIADDLYLKVTRGVKEESVHLEKWPVLKEERGKRKEESLIQEMEAVRKIVSLGLEARAKANIKVRQPLSKLKVKSGKLKEEYLVLIKDEVNVKEVIFEDRLQEEVELDTNITPELKEGGDLRDLIRAIQDFRKNEGLTPSDKVAIQISAPEETVAIVEKYAGELKGAALLTSIETKKGEELSFALL